MSSMQTTGPAELTVRNVGGIDSAEVELDPGVTLLEGRNATNRTSLLQALAAAMGSEQATLKGDAEEGEVRLRMGDRTYTRTFERSGRTVTTGGDPYLEDAEVADLFAFLFGSNEARRAVANGDDLREIIMRPVDTDALEDEIDRLRRERDRLDDEIAELDDLADRLPDLERERRELRERIDEKREELATVRSTIESLDADPEERQAHREELDQRLTELNERRSDLEDVESRIEAEEASIESLRAEHEEKTAELAEVPEVPEGELDRIESDLSRLRERKRSVQSTANRLQGIVEFNEEMLEGDRPEALDRLNEGGDVLDELLGDEERTVACWTCGSEVERTAIDETQRRLREISAELLADRDELDEEIAATKERARELQSRQDRRERIERRIERVESEIADREETLSDLQERRDDLREEVDRLETAVEDLRAAEGDDEVLERRQEASEIEFEIDRLEDDLAAVEEEIDTTEGRLAERDRLEERREAVSDELVECRTRVEEIEAEAVESFNDHVERLLGLLEYENVERVWIEPTEVERRRGRRTVSAREFDLHVVRTGEDGTAYEDSVDTLSESEREVVGLVFALAGYLAHDLHEAVPFVLLDSLEAIDAGRIATLVDHFSSQAEYLVVALLPEDAEEVEADRRITEI